MQREFNIGDIAHLSRTMITKGILNSDNGIHKSFNLKPKTPVEIIKWEKAGDEKCEWFKYDCLLDSKGVLYIIEAISQMELVSKKAWNTSMIQGRHISALESGYKFIAFEDAKLKKSINADFDSVLLLEDVIKYGKVILENDDLFIEIAEWEVIGESFIVSYKIVDNKDI